MKDGQYGNGPREEKHERGYSARQQHGTHSPLRSTISRSKSKKPATHSSAAVELMASSVVATTSLVGEARDQRTPRHCRADSAAAAETDEEAVSIGAPCNMPPCGARARAPPIEIAVDERSADGPADGPSLRAAAGENPGIAPPSRLSASCIEAIAAAASGASTCARPRRRANRAASLESHRSASRMKSATLRQDRTAPAILVTARLGEWRI